MGNAHGDVLEVCRCLYPGPLVATSRSSRGHPCHCAAKESLCAWHEHPSLCTMHGPFSFLSKAWRYCVLCRGAPELVFHKTLWGDARVTHAVFFATLFRQ